MTEILIPDIGDAEDVEVIELCVGPGDVVTPDDAIIVIESDKASMEVPSGVAGTIEALLVAIGDKVVEGQAIASVLIAAETDPAPESIQPEAEALPESAAAVPEPQLESTKEVVVEIPDIGEAEDVVVIEVAVSVGDVVTPDQMLVVVESDKASMEIPANVAGEITAVHVAEGDSVIEGSPLVTLLVAQSTVQPAIADPVPAAAPEVAVGDERADAVARTIVTEVETTGASGIYAGPATRRLARELGVHLNQVNGSGSRGRIVKDDVKAHVKQAMRSGSAGSGIPPVPEIDFSKFGPVELVALSRVRVVGAQNLHRSWLNVAHVTQHDQADLTELEEFRQSLKGEAEARGVKLTPLAFIVKACCYALKAFPTFNASLDRDVRNYIFKHYYNIGFAVDTEQGLVVPVIKNADKKGVWALSEEIAALAGKAREQKLGIDDMQGGTFSISSLGAIGGTGFTPIVNAPEVAILGVARLTTQPVWNGTDFVPRKVLPLSLSYDHRAINGAEAGRFVVHLTELLTDIRRLSL